MVCVWHVSGMRMASVPTRGAWVRGHNMPRVQGETAGPNREMKKQNQKQTKGILADMAALGAEMAAHVPPPCPRPCPPASHPALHLIHLLPAPPKKSSNRLECLDP